MSERCDGGPQVAGFAVGFLACEGKCGDHPPFAVVIHPPGCERPIFVSDDDAGKLARLLTEATVKSALRQGKVPK